MITESEQQVIRELVARESARDVLAEFALVAEAEMLRTLDTLREANVQGYGDAVADQLNGYLAQLNHRRIVYTGAASVFHSLQGASPASIGSFFLKLQQQRVDPNQQELFAAEQAELDTDQQLSLFDEFRPVVFMDAA